MSVIGKKLWNDCEHLSIWCFGDILLSILNLTCFKINVATLRRVQQITCNFRGHMQLVLAVQPWWLPQHYTLGEMEEKNCTPRYHPKRRFKVLSVNYYCGYCDCEYCVLNRPGVARAVVQTPLLLINWFIWSAILFLIIFKNPALRRHWILRSMRRKAPISLSLSIDISFFNLLLSDREVLWKCCWSAVEFQLKCKQPTANSHSHRPSHGHTYRQTSRLYDGIRPVGKFSEHFNPWTVRQVQSHM